MAASLSANAQLVRNGSFETPSLNTAPHGSFLDWTSSGNSGAQANGANPQNLSTVNGDWYVGYNSPFPTAADGKNYAVLGPTAQGNVNTGNPPGGPGYLAQNVPTTAGDVYQVTFYLQEETFGDPSDLDNLYFTATMGGKTLIDINSTGSPTYTYHDGTFNATYDASVADFVDAAKWTAFTFDYTAGATPFATLQFGFETDVNNAADWGLDNVSVQDLTNPANDAGAAWALYNPVGGTVPDSGMGIGLVGAVFLGVCGFAKGRRGIVAS